MRRRCMFLAILLTLCLYFINTTKVYAMNTGFLTEKLSQKETDIFIENINILLLNEEPERKAIRCFDVSSDGLIALGQNNGERKEVCIYSTEGVFQYGYSFKCGQSFGVEWSNENINIYFVRSDVIVTLNCNGNIMAIAEVSDTIENNTYRNHLLYSQNRIVGNNTYSVKNDMGLLNLIATSYSQLLFVNADGEEVVLYDVNSTQFTQMLLICIGVIVFFLPMLIVLIRHFFYMTRGGSLS